MKIGIIGAMDIEVASLIEAMDSRVDTMIACMTFSKGTIANTSCVVVQSGVGKVNAALCVQILVCVFGITHIINTGVAGSLDARIDICDIVVSADCVYHDVDATNFGYEPGQVPGMPYLAFTADAALRNTLVAAAHTATSGIGVYVGRIASGDRFICDNATKQQIATRFRALCCEMEGAAIAHACTLNDVPFVVVRVISDKADGSEEMLYPVFERKAAAISACLVKAFLNNFAS